MNSDLLLQLLFYLFFIKFFLGLIIEHRVVFWMKRISLSMSMFIKIDEQYHFRQSEDNPHIILLSSSHQSINISKTANIFDPRHLMPSFPLFQMMPIIIMNDNEVRSIYYDSQIAQNDPRQHIHQQIQSCKSRLSQYQQLQKQIQEINLRIATSQRSHTDLSKHSKSKSGVDPRSPLPSQPRKSSHKKIKIYELQKKYEKMAREISQKKSNFQKCQDYHNKQLSLKIQDQRKTSQNLKSLSLQIESELQTAEGRMQEEVISLSHTAQNKQQHSFQRRKLRDNINRLKNTIYNLTNNLTQQLQLSHSDYQFQEIIRSNDSVQNNTFTLSNSKIEKPTVINISQWVSKQNRRIEAMLSKYQSNIEKGDYLLNNFYNFKKEMVSNEILIKHHRLTNSLYSNKLKDYESINADLKDRIQKRSNLMEKMVDKNNQVEGQSGYLRGKIGVKIEQQRLIRSLNSLLQQQYERLREKYNQLKLLKSLLQFRSQ